MKDEINWSHNGGGVAYLLQSFAIHFNLTVSSVKCCSNHQKENIAYLPLDPVADYVYIADLILDSMLSEKCYLTKFLN